jgi:hypothetical protein
MQILFSTTERLDPVRECVWDAGEQSSPDFIRLKIKID